jgi:hypothetical protein
MTTAEKIARAVRTEKVFPADVPGKDCWLSHTRPVWRLENGQAVLVADEIYRWPKNQYGKIPGVFGRSEFGAEIVLAIAYQVYVVGLSFDKVMPVDQLLPEPETAEVAGRRPLEAVDAAMGRGVRRAVPVPSPQPFSDTSCKLTVRNDGQTNECTSVTSTGAHSQQTSRGHETYRKSTGFCKAHPVCAGCVHRCSSNRAAYRVSR